MRHIDDLKFELEAMLYRAQVSKDVASVNSLAFCLDTLQQLQQALEKEIDDEAT